MKNMLFKNDKLPYFYILILGIIGIQINYMVKLLIEAPVVEYDIKSAATTSKNNLFEREFSCDFFNISKETNFDSLTFSFTYESKISSIIKLVTPQVTTIHPSSLKAPVLSSSDDSSLTNLTLYNFQPGFKYTFSFKSVSQFDPGSDPYLYLTSGRVVKLENKSFTTWIIKNQFIINIGIIIFLIIIAIFYSFYLNKSL